MKKKKVLNLIKLSLISFIALSFINVLPAQALPDIDDPIVFRPQIGLPGLVDKGKELPLSSDTRPLANMIKGFYNYGLSIAGILAAIVLMAGGVIWLTSGGSSEKVSQAKGLIGGSITGLLLLMGAWLMLRTINPNLVDFKIQDIGAIDRIELGCCQLNSGSQMLSNDVCDEQGGQFMGQSADGRVYSVDATTKNCTISGCCVKKSMGEITQCYNTLSSNCNTGLSDTDFFDTTCSSVDAKCPNDLCSDPKTKDGDSCYESVIVNACSCYNNLAWRGKGQVGEPCGNEKYSKCDLNEPQNGDTCNRDWKGGRDCEDSICCTFTSEGLRIND